MQDQLLFITAVAFNLIGATLMLAVIGVTLSLSWRERLNRLLAAYVGVSLFWSLSALTGRLVMTSTVFDGSTGNEGAIHSLVYIVLITITGNSPFLLAFVTEYIGKWHDTRMRLARWAAFALTGFNVVMLYFNMPLYVSEYGITEVGMITIEPTDIALPMIGLGYFLWYGVSIYLLWKHSWPRSKWICLGAFAVAMGLAIEIVSSISDILPIAIVLTGIGIVAFAFSIWRDNVFSPMVTQNLELEQSRTNMQQIISAIPGCVIITDKHGVIKWANDKIVEIYGYTPDELMGVQIATLYNDQEDRRKVLDNIADTGRMLDYELYYKHRSGKTRLTRVQIVRIIYDGIEANLGIVQDIQEERQVEESLQQMQKWESLAVLAGGIAHDFNNLLVAILGQSSVAKAKLSEADPAFRHIEKVESAARRASTLTHQMLAYSGRGTFMIRPININEVFRENLSLLDVTIPKDIKLNTELDADLPLVMADPAQIQQVIMNLIINASEAVKGARGNISVTTGVVVDPDLSQGRWMKPESSDFDGSYVSLSVADSGIGIDEVQINQIFDPFFTTKQTGTGLGLAAVVGIMRGHKGAIQVTSELGVGTRFSLLLPALPVDAENEPVVDFDSAEPVPQ